MLNITVPITGATAFVTERDRAGTWVVAINEPGNSARVAGPYTCTSKLSVAIILLQDMRDLTMKLTR